MTPSHTIEANPLPPTGPSLSSIWFCVNCGRPTEAPDNPDNHCKDCGHALCERCCDIGKDTSGPIFTSVRRRSKASQIPDLVPVAKVTLRQLFARAAVGKALKAFKRHGEKSYQFVKAMRSRWLVKE